MGHPSTSHHVLQIQFNLVCIQFPPYFVLSTHVAAYTATSTNNPPQMLMPTDAHTTLEQSVSGTESLLQQLNVPSKETFKSAALPAIRESRKSINYKFLFTSSPSPAHFCIYTYLAHPLSLLFSIGTLSSCCTG